MTSGYDECTRLYSTVAHWFTYTHQYDVLHRLSAGSLLQRNTVLSINLNIHKKSGNHHPSCKSRSASLPCHTYQCGVSLPNVQCAVFSSEAYSVCLSFFYVLARSKMWRFNIVTCPWLLVLMSAPVRSQLLLTGLHTHRDNDVVHRLSAGSLL